MGSRKIVVFGTGGTIAGTSAMPGATLGYVPAQLGVAQLLESVAGRSGVAGGVEIVSEQLAQIDSKDMDFALWQQLAQRCAQCLTDPCVVGVVITHGSDTLEETAWFLHSVLEADKPVVLTCAMRPATALAPDGPQNLMDALTAASTRGARGVLVVVAGQVHSALAVQKDHPYRLDAFSSGEAGPLGWVEAGCLRLANHWPSEASGQWSGALAQLLAGAPRPWVEVVMSYAGASGLLVDALVQAGVQGLVIAGTGNGTVHRALTAALERGQAQGVRVVRSTRCAQGRVLALPDDAMPDSGGLSPVKARITLMLELLIS